jgi:hypothetical protein
MINNLELIKPLLNFEDKGDFYMLYVFKRKKDQPEEERDNHQSVRTIKTYCVDSVEYLEKRYDEIKMLCETFKARAYIHVTKQNHKDVAMNMITEIVGRIQSGQINQQHVFDSVVGQIKTKERRWIVDIDSHSISEKNRITNIIERIRPTDSGSKIIATIPTKNGVHLITKRFDVNEFHQQSGAYERPFREIPDIQKKNPTLLYYPDSLDSDN